MVSEPEEFNLNRSQLDAMMAERTPRDITVHAREEMIRTATMVGTGLAVGFVLGWLIMRNKTKIVPTEKVLIQGDTEHDKPRLNRWGTNESSRATLF